MSITKTIGGDRLGSGKQMQTSLHNYNRSNHNLSRSWRSTMAPGVLTPFLVEPALNGDTFDIDLDAMARTIPTQGPLMGTFKLQMDVFLCPIRLYHAVLHNNPMEIGLKMQQITLPKLTIKKTFNEDETNEDKIKSLKFANNCLMKYLGMSGLGAPADESQEEIQRFVNGVPLLAYYDIFKNYYANKQEEKAYVISGKNMADISEITRIACNYTKYGSTSTQTTVEEDEFVEQNNRYTLDFSELITRGKVNEISIIGEELKTTRFKIIVNDLENDYVWESFLDEPNDTINIIENNNNRIRFILGSETKPYFINSNYTITIIPEYVPKTDQDIALVPFDLKNLDTAREKILQGSAVGSYTTGVQIGDGEGYEINFLPYSINAGETNEKVLYNTFKMNGLVVKTYQSDLFNAWVNTEWIEVISGINGITTIDTSDGLNLDTLNLAQKVYNMLNRIAVSGGSYEDWQEAVYGVKAIRHAESPIYCGGMSSEIVFEEVISTAGTTEDKLGTLAGKGTLAGQKGGKLHIKVTEPAFIIGLVSITPRVDYTQGNKWYLTEIRSMNDFHKPALDGIGFQDLIEEQAAWWSTTIDDNDTVLQRTIGKVPAWINYMTAVDEAFGDFAEEEGKNFMILARNYARQTGTNKTIDMTTYIEPEKFNYAFAYTELAAQNFWVQIYSHITARRIMSAKIIPNL